MFRKTVLVRALSIAFSTAVLSMAVAPAAMAQSNATGNILGRVDNPGGASISLVNTDTGLKRSASVEASGRYLVTALPVGHYRVELVRGGQVASATEVDVIAGQGADASFAAVQSVQVTGRRSRIDVSNTNNGAVFTAKEMERLPIANNLTSIALLAPNTTRGDAAYGGASFGGSGVSENAFYVNGFPITNPLTQLGSMELPFGAIAQASVITGGFGAEFGRSIGGVMNLTTKSGTNNWEAGAKFSIAPDQMRAKTVNTHYGRTGYVDNVDTDGKLHFRNDNNYNNTETYGAYVGGPLIKDKLFMFAAAETGIIRRGFLDVGTAATNIGQDGWHQRRNVQERYAVKLDWNLTDNHRIEFTGLGDDQQEKRQVYGYVLNPNNPNALAQLDGVRNDVLYSELSTRNPGSTGAQVNALKYTGNLTDDLTLTTMYGHLNSKRGVTYTGVTTGLPPSIVVPAVANRVPSLNAQNLYRNFNKFFSLPSQPNLTVPGEDKVKSFRLDVEYKLGDHILRAGLDNNKLEAANAGQLVAGGSRWSYRKVRAGNEFIEQNLSGGRPGIVGNFGGFGPQGYYARQRMFSSVTNASAEQAAQYLEDKWQVTKNLLVTGGIRNESYSNSNGDGEKFIDMKRQVAPRLSASWDVNGDATMKVFGSAGRYYLQLPTQVAARAASRSTLTDQDFTYTGIDPATGAPTGLRAINAAASPDGEWGTPKDPRSVVAKDLKPNFQDELTLGFEKAFSPDINFGAKVTLRKLGAGIDDNCDTRRLYSKAQELGIEVHSKEFMNCYIFNPGEEATVWIGAHDASGQPISSPKAQYVTFSAKDLGFPKAERSYRALDVFLEHPFRGGWYGKVNYTLSRSYGNMEGQTRSDTGQTDIGTSAAWDFPEFTAYGTGLLPNDRKHQLKAYGFYELTPEFSVGASLLVQSGRPKTCLGTNVAAENGELDPFGDQGGPGYGAEYYWCNGKPAPRGTLGRTPWEKQLDLSLMYKPAALKGLSFKMDVFNVANAQKPTARQETYDDGTGAGILGNYGEDRSTQTPRFAKFSVEYNHKF
jgi:hypothetical protein